MLQVTSSNIEISESMKTLAKDKLQKIEKFFDGDMNDDSHSYRVVLNKGSAEDTFEAKVELSWMSHVWVGDATDYTLESALVKAVEDVERQYKKDKAKKEHQGWEEKREMKRYEYEESDSS